MSPRRRPRAEPDAREAPGLFEVALEEAPRAPRPAVTVAPAAEEPGESPASAIAVATLTTASRDVVEGSFPALWVRGEVVSFKEHRNGHWYFTLKDQDAQIRCVAWSADVRRMRVAPDDGMAVAVRGQLTVYAARGDLQLRVTAMEGIGDGLWRKAFEQIRQRLAADGLLDPARKRPLPAFPQCIAVVTSIDGAALHDIVAVVSRRCRGTRVVAVPAAVQGDGAPESIVAALARVARWGCAEVVIVGRGGGSREDLWAFNDEAVARAVAAMPVPVIAAVGHEIDITICDLVADYRAPTPSAAAEAAVPVLAELARQVQAMGAALGDTMVERLAEARERLAVAAGSLTSGAERLVERRRASIETLGGRLHALSPLATMRRGFAAVGDADGHAITSARQVSAGDRLQIRLRDGAIAARAESVTLTPSAEGKERG